MGSLTINGIITRYANYRDNDRMLTLFTGERGLISASARGCRRVKSALHPVCELFVYGEFVLFENRGRYSVDSCEVMESFYPLRESVPALAAALYMLSLVNASAAEGDESRSELSMLLHALSFTAYSKAEPVDMALCFASRYLSARGYRPALTACAACGADLRAEKKVRFSASMGGAVCAECARDYMWLEPVSLEAVRRMLLLSDGEMSKVVLPDKVRAELKNAVNSFAEAALEHGFKAMDSL